MAQTPQHAGGFEVSISDLKYFLFLVGGVFVCLIVCARAVAIRPIAARVPAVATAGLRRVRRLPPALPGLLLARDRRGQRRQR